MNLDATALQGKIKELRAAFIASMPSRLAEARSGINDISTGGKDKRGESIRVLFHTLKGTAGSFGMREIEQVATEAEKFVRIALENETIYESDTVRSVKSYVDALEAATVSIVEGNEESKGGNSDTETAQDGFLAKRQLVYLCDDDAMQAALLVNQLEIYGFDIKLFTSPGDLESAIGQKMPRIIILDLMFADNPDGGAIALERLRAQKVLCPVIFISARSDFRARYGAVRAGGDAYFVKPVNVMQLAKKLNDFIDQHTPEPYRVLVIDDDSIMSELHKAMLEDAGMEARCVNDPTTALDAAKEFRPDLALVDMNMPPCSGYDLAKIIRQIPDYDSMPIIYLSSETDKVKQLSAMGVGADGFLTKPIKQSELVQTVGIRAERMRLLRMRMTTDGLTGLYNHTATMQLFMTALEYSRRHSTTLIFAMLDIDNFKLVNDTYGHPIGDQVLATLSRTIKQRLRATDIVGRYGGEEFAVLLQNTNKNEAFKLLDMIRERFHSIVFEADEKTFQCSFSCGIASSSDYPTLEPLKEAADNALYKAKREGKNVICIKNPARGDVASESESE